MKILFVTPPYHAGVVESAGRWMPLSFVYLAGAARAEGCQAEIYDAMTKQHTLADVCDELERREYDILAISSITPTMPATIDVLREVRRLRPAAITIVGGVHPTFCHRDLFAGHGELIDYIVRGEGEVVLRQLLRCLQDGMPPDTVAGIAFMENGQLRETPCPEFIENLDGLPMAWDLVEWSDYEYYVLPGSRLGAVSTSRGCSHECSFCSQQKFWEKTWRGRDPASVVSEIRMLHTTYGVDVMLLVDEYPTKDEDRWMEIIDRLVHARLDTYLLMETRVEDIVRDARMMHKYREAGIVHVYIGVEATSQATLDRIKKDISVEESEEAIRLLASQNIITETSFVLGFPWETPESIENTLALAMRYGPDFAHFLAITPWPYADMYEELKDAIEVQDFAKYNLVEPILRSDTMSRDEIRQAIVECYARYYMHRVPEYFRIRDPFKREYLRRSMRLIMRNSFLTELIRTSGVAAQFSAMHRHLTDTELPPR